eukprot:9073488-Pyramimonas_sp.AAC.2
MAASSSARRDAHVSEAPQPLSGPARCPIRETPYGSECKYAEGPSRLTLVAFIAITPCCGICVDLNFLDGHVHGKGY